MTIRVTGPDDDGLLWIRADAGGLHGAVSVRAGSIAGRAFAAAGDLSAPPSPGERERGTTAKVVEAARAMLAKLEALQDAVDHAPRTAGFKPLPREQRESVEHKALREALAALDPAPSRSERTEDGDPGVRAYVVRVCEQCRRLEGEMCHNPACVFCRRTTAEIGEMLDVLLLRPVVDGERLDLTGAPAAPQTTPVPEGPPCPKCGVTGALEDFVGSIDDRDRVCMHCCARVRLPAPRLSTEGAAAPGKEDDRG